MSGSGGNLLQRYPVSSTFVLFVASAVAAALITSNLSGIGDWLAHGLQTGLLWIAAVAGAVGLAAALYMLVRLFQAWPRRL